MRLSGAWKYHVPFKDLLDTDDFSPEAIEGLGKQIVARFRAQIEEGQMPDLDEALEYLSLQDCEQGFDYQLNELYDVCDRRRIWCGI